MCPARGSRRLAAQLRCRCLPAALSMHIPKPTARRCLLLGLMIAGLVVLADSVARNELHNAMSDMAFSISGTASDGVR